MHQRAQVMRVASGLSFVSWLLLCYSLLQPLITFASVMESHGVVLTPAVCSDVERERVHVRAPANLFVKQQLYDLNLLMAETCIEYGPLSSPSDQAAL
jgi:hypothetical protein